MAINLVIYAAACLAKNHAPLMGSGFTTVIANSLHFNADRSLNIGDTTYVTANGQLTAAADHLKEVVADLKKNGGVRQVLLSVGGGGCFMADPKGINNDHSVSDSDYKNFSSHYWGAVGMTDDLSNEIPILHGFGRLLERIGADGIDLDPEPLFYTYESLAAPTLIMTEWAVAKQGLIATWVPFEARRSWQAMAQLLSVGSGSALAWINLQPPAWTGGAEIQSWAASLGVGVQAIVPGFNCIPTDVCVTPAEVQQALAGVVNGGVAIEGAYVWNYDNIVDDVAAYAAAMKAGLAGNPG